MKENKFKRWLLIKLADLLYGPEIIFENESVQSRSLNEPCVIICNHENLKDGALLQYLFKAQGVCSLMAKDMLDKLRWKLVVSGCMCIPVDREKAGTSWIHDCLEQLKNGNSVIIFPEGTTHKENPIEEFKPGFALLAKSADVKILPVAMNGEYRIFTKGRIKFKIGTPTALRKSSMTRNYIQNEADRFQQIVSDMYYELGNDENYSNEEIEMQKGI